MKYKDADEFILYHEDDDVLDTIKVKLPKPPPYKTIDGYGKKYKEQFFERPEYPIKLKKLEKKSESIHDIWVELTRYRDYYAEEIEFIKQEWDRVINGYWFFLNGKPTYIDGWHYRYLTYWPLDIGLPDYRSRDRKFFIFVRYCYTTTEAYYRYKISDADTGTVISYFSTERELQKFARQYDYESIEATRGHYFVDLKRRVCFGINYPKHRREGATYKADEILFSVISMAMNAHGGIQSMDGPSAKKAFSKAVVKPWKKQPFFLNPEYTNSTDPKKAIDFDIPSRKVNGKTTATILSGLESQITFAESANRGWYDGDKLLVLHNDECGKTMLEDVNERWQVQRRCLAQAINIHGLSLNTSTVGEMSEKGGAAFYRLCDNSHFSRRNKLGQTISGLYNLFIPASDGLEGFIDIFGESIIEDPEEDEVWRWKNPIRDSNGKLVGAKRYLFENLQEILLRNDPESVKEYEEEIRLHPVSYRQCFLTSGSGSGLDIKKITQRYTVVRFDRSLTRRGNLKWKNDIIDGEVIWIDDPINGRFIKSLDIPDALTNQRVAEVIKDPLNNEEEKRIYRPMYPWKMTAGADPFKFNKTEGNRLSKGAGAVFLNRDRTIDPSDKPKDKWETHRFIMTYSFRPREKSEYAEDMLMMCVYTGAMMYPEINIPLVWEHFIERGYDGYLKYEYSPSGVFKKTPGFNMRGSYQQKCMQVHQEYVSNYIMLERHKEILEEQKKIKGVEDLTNRDLFVACGAALMGSEIDYRPFFENEEFGGGSGLDDYL